MKKRDLSLILIIACLVFTLGFVSAAEGCCEKLNNGAWCQTTTQDQCAGSIAPTSCDSFSPCTLGTCVDEEKGDCTPNTPRSLCEIEGGLWDPLSKSEIPMCKNGCCLFGEYASFSTQTECKQLASVYGVDVTFRSDVTAEFSCYTLASPDVKGACVVTENQTLRDCASVTRESCVAVGGEFHEGFLCTASELATDCAKSEKTTCKDDKVYFTDTCGNLANVYDETMYSKNPELWNEQMEDYWTKIQEPSCFLTEGSSSCGDCSYIAGSVCKEYNAGNKVMPNKPAYGDYVCANLDCYYDTDGDKIDEIYKHGESWCAQSEGAYPGIDTENQSLEFLDENFEEEIADYFKYDIPGSRYYRLMCIDGEVIIEPCRDFRNEICLQSDMGDATENFKVAQCQINTWRECFNHTKQENCEETVFCKWVPGYRFDGKVVTDGGNRNQDEQGSCLPSFAPGFDFWEPGSDGEAICSLANIQETVTYETNLFTKRDNFKDNPICDLSMNSDAVQRCFRNCYAIPGYGLESPAPGGYTGLDNDNYLDLQDLLNVHAGVNNALPKKFEKYCISDRRGYYCPDKTGEVGGNDIKCADTKGVTPIFLTHKEWITSIGERAKSLGDCGYKPGIYADLEDIDPELELMTVIFQKTGQKGDIKSNGSVEKLYIGGFEYVAGQDGGDYRTEGEN